jgi:hypothetical protein
MRLSALKDCLGRRCRCSFSSIGSFYGVPRPPRPKVPAGLRAQAGAFQHRPWLRRRLSMKTPDIRRSLLEDRRARSAARVSTILNRARCCSDNFLTVPQTAQNR